MLNRHMRVFSFFLFQMAESESYLFELDDELTEKQESLMKRPMCQNCDRPVAVCICPALPKEPIRLRRTSVFVFQHPNEVKRPLGTVQILSKCLDPSSLTVVPARQFPRKYFSELYDNPNTYVLFPNANAYLLDDIVEENQHYNIIAIDGTWSEAMGIYNRHPDLQKLKTCYVKIDKRSEFVIRTQPTKETVSTLESVAYALRSTEREIPEIFDQIVGPLKHMVSQQLDLGAVVHEAKLSLIEKGQSKRQYSKKHERWLLSLQH